MTDLKMGPLNLGVTRYANDASDDFYAANWLTIDVACDTDQGAVAFQAPCLMTTDLLEFTEECAELLSGKGRQAFLVSLEPQVDVCIGRGDGPDTFTLDIELTPDVDDDENIYGLSTTVSRADVERMAEQAAQIAKAFPVRGEQDE